MAFKIRRVALHLFSPDLLPGLFSELKNESSRFRFRFCLYLPASPKIQFSIQVEHSIQRELRFLLILQLHEKFLQFDWLRAVVFHLI